MSQTARPRGRELLWYAVAGLVLAAAAVLLWTARTTTSPEHSASASSFASVAVLPFENLSPNPAHRYFALGLQEEVLNQLANQTDLEVASRTSVMRYAGGTASLPEIARDLGVDAVLEGSVRYADGRVRIAVQLIDGTSDRPLWSRLYERDFADVFEIQSDIAMNVARLARSDLTAAEAQARNSDYVPSPAAHLLYLEARGLLLTRADAGVYDLAHALLDRAIEIDPQYARTYALKAVTDSVSYIFGSASATYDEAWIGRTRALAERALALDAGAVEARTALRNMDMLTWNWSVLEHSIPPPTEPELLQLWMLSLLGRHSEALQRGQRLVELNPHAINAHFGLGVAQAFAGDRTASLASVRRALEMAPGNAYGRVWLAFNAIALGDHDAALRDLRLTEELLGENRYMVVLPDLAYAYSRIGHSREARRLAEEISGLAADADIGAGAWVLTHLASGDEQQALEWLEVAADKARSRHPDRGFLQLMNLKMNYLADPRLEEPPFADVLARIRGN